ncbi:MAG TPA: hypothetical protein VK003_19020, partial [Oceanobacillus sp.]|nr:hypothetical protein [Oceanobacillus sp.]
GLYIFPRSVPPPEDWREWLEAGRINDLPLGPDGRTAFEAFRVAGDTPLPGSTGLAATSVRNPYLTLVGLQSTPIAAGERGDVVVDWRVDSPIPVRDLTPIIELRAAQGAQLFRVHQVLTETDEWRVGEVVLDRVEVDVPVGTPPGEYILRVAWVERSSNQYVTYLTEDGTQGGIWAEVGSLTVVRPAQFPDAATFSIDQRNEVDFAEGIRLLGWDNLPQTLRPGESIPVTLYWQGITVEDERAEVVLTASLRNAAGKDTVLWTGTPTDNQHPVSEWLDSELVMDHLSWVVPREQANGSYQIILSVGDSEIPLGTVEIAGVARVFDPPTVLHRSDVQFGAALDLWGYTLETNEDGLYLSLVWHADDVVSADYKVFVHVVDENGAIISQRDAMPLDNTYPTSLWLVGEYVEDRYNFEMPDQSYSIRVGLYLPETGERLPVEAGGEIQPDGYLVINP